MLDHPLSQIEECEHRKDVQARFPDGRVFSGPAGTRLESFVRAALLPQSIPVVAALVNGRLADLTEPVIVDVDVEPVSLGAEDGMRIYQRSLILLMEVAARELFQVHMDVDYSLTYGGLYCHAQERALTEKEVTQIEARMRAIFAEDAPIGREVVRIDDAIAGFQSQGDAAQVRLLSQANRKEVTLCSLHDVKDYFFGRLLVPSAGYLRQFAVYPYPPGLALQFPQRTRPISLEPPQRSPKLTAVSEQYGQWLSLLGVPDVGALNQALAQSRAREIVLVAEALHEQRIAEIATSIAARKRVRLIAIAGPSSSGKTTFARRLTIQLLANGLRPFPISLDDYFVAREETPRDVWGNYDYENLHALDLSLFNEQLLALMNGERVTLPRYDFEQGDRQEGPAVQLSSEHVLLIEGIHGLNPNLVPKIPAERVYRIYVSALTQLKLSRLNRISTTDTRLIRRIVRDARARGYNARDTIARWESVRRGEDRNIFPYQEQADIMFNSALVFELAVLKPLAEPLLRQVEPGTPEYVEARRLLMFLEWFSPCDASLVPETSILREFIGGSVVSDFVPHL
ncbi:MAG: nucleoside kinase [Chloroflexota bacterium]|nr:nucleoside kinase [Chloroflexota bacterium]